MLSSSYKESANLASAFVGGLPVSGICSDAVENASLGAQTPVAGMLQAVLLVAFLILVAPAARFIPLPLISALILSRVFRMTDWREIHSLTRGPRFELITWGRNLCLYDICRPADRNCGGYVYRDVSVHTKPTATCSRKAHRPSDAMVTPVHRLNVRCAWPRLSVTDKRNTPGAFLRIPQFYRVDGFEY
jgi:hypothetical protein